MIITEPPESKSSCQAGTVEDTQAHVPSWSIPVPSPSQVSGLWGTFSPSTNLLNAQHSQLPAGAWEVRDWPQEVRAPLLSPGPGLTHTPVQDPWLVGFHRTWLVLGDGRPFPRHNSLICKMEG